MGAVDDGNDQTIIVERDRNPEVDCIVTCVGLVLEPGVQRRVLPQRGDRRAGNEGQRGHAQRRASSLDPAHIDLDPGRTVGRRLERALHVLADLFAHARELARAGTRR